MAKFRKKPTVIEAEQYVRYGKLVTGMCNSQSCYTAGNTDPHVHTIHNAQIVLLEVGDWVVMEPVQEADFPSPGPLAYPVKPDIFEATYEPAGE